MTVKVIFCILQLIHLNCGIFVEIPTSKTIFVGESAKFRCRHTTADTIRWRVNGTVISNSRPPVDISPEIINEGGVLVNILTIIGRPEYNDTDVVGVARFDDESPDETTYPPAVLRVLLNTTHGLSQFIEEPLSLNVTIGEKAVFRCEHRSADAISWRINGTSLINRPDLHDDFIDDNIGRLKTLTVTTLIKYNITVVQCVALFSSGNSQRDSTAPAFLQMQGTLNKVNTLFRNFSSLSWNPPFSLDLTNVEPDIIYCVDVYNITCGGRELLISDCNVTETSYTSDVIAPGGYIYEYIVTPRSNVEGAVNGTPSQPLRDILPSFFRLSNELFVKDGDKRGYKTDLLFREIDQPVPSLYSLSLTCFDGLGDIGYLETVTERNGSLLTLTTLQDLPPRRLCELNILAYGCENITVLNGTDHELSTHDIQNISVTSAQPGEVRVTGDFIDGSTATGLLIIIINGNKKVHYHISKSNWLSVEYVYSALATSQYIVSVFVVEKSGLPFERIATRPKTIFINHTLHLEQLPGLIIEYSLQSTSTGVCITCTFLDSSATDCVAVVHQRISQLSSSGLMNIESSHKLTRSGDTASGCIEGVNMEDYQVGVVDGKLVHNNNGDSCFSSDTGCTIGILVSLCVIIITVALTTVLLILYFAKKGGLVNHQNSTPDHEEVAVDMKNCAAYEITSIARKKVVMETNPAYEQVRVDVD